jgi:poly(3-hydroxyalkanoate) synthetase
MKQCVEQMDKYVDQTKLFWNAFNARESQIWTLPHNDLYEDDFMIVKLFKEGTSGEIRIINPPMAGHHSNIAVRAIDYYVKNTDDTIISIEWKPATEKTKDFGIEEVIDKVGMAIFIAAGDVTKVHLAGLCQGGWALVMWAALNPERVKSIVIAGTPIDYVIDGGKCQNWLSMVSNQYIKNVIRQHGGIWPGENQLLGFKMLNPMDRFYGTYQKLMKLVEVGDVKGIKKWVRNNSWYEYVQDLPGKFIIEVCDWLFRKNKLIKKELVINGQVVDLSKITCPFVCITGDDDDITLTRQCTEALRYISTPEEYTEHYPIPKCGHIAIFLTNEAMKRWDAATKFIEKCLENR